LHTPVFSGGAYEKIENSVFSEVVVSDTIPLKQHSDKITVLSTADLFAEVIRRIENFESINSLFIMDESDKK
jgi:ribose-phosphate pyrophosphokinase